MRRRPPAWMTAVLLTAVFACQGSPARQPSDPARILDHAPARPNPDARYVIYVHGRIVQEQGPRPTHPRYGTYEHRRILEALASPETIVIGPVRAPGTTVDDATSRTLAALDDLIGAGVPPDHVTVVGFSMGGAVAIQLASRQPHDALRFVLLAACGAWTGQWLRDQPGLALHGTVLSITEASDELTGPCTALRSAGIGLLELEIAIGDGHGAFYRPHPEWTEPTRAWITGEQPEVRPPTQPSDPG